MEHVNGTASAETTPAACDALALALVEQPAVGDVVCVLLFSCAFSPNWFDFFIQFINIISIIFELIEHNLDTGCHKQYWRLSENLKTLFIKYL
jgi:hypothetical protein